MTANFEEKKREKRNRDKENLILLRVDRRIEKRKKKEKGESLERERGTFELALFVSSPLFIKSLGNASRYENVCNFSFLLRVFNGLLTYELFPRRRPALHETAPVFFSPLPLPLEKKNSYKSLPVYEKIGGGSVTRHHIASIWHGVRIGWSK